MGAVEHTGDGTVGSCYGACEGFADGFVRLTLADAVSFAKAVNSDDYIRHGIWMVRLLLWNGFLIAFTLYTCPKNKHIAIRDYSLKS